MKLPAIQDDDIVLYVEGLYAPTIANLLNQSVLQLPEDWLSKVPARFVNREVKLSTLGSAWQLLTPKFIKPPNDKSFEAKVYQGGNELTRDFDESTPVLISDPVEWIDEFRCFCLDSTVMTLSPYLRQGVLARETDYSMSDDESRAVIQFAEKCLSELEQFTPRAVVLDVGLLSTREWGIVEANAAWGSGIYGCDPDRVLDVIRHATLPK